MSNEDLPCGYSRRGRGCPGGQKRPQQNHDCLRAAAPFKHSVPRSYSAPLHSRGVHPHKSEDEEPTKKNQPNVKPPMQQSDFRATLRTSEGDELARGLSSNCGKIRPSVIHIPHLEGTSGAPRTQTTDQLLEMQNRTEQNRGSEEEEIQPRSSPRFQSQFTETEQAMRKGSCTVGMDYVLLSRARGHSLALSLDRGPKSDHGLCAPSLTPGPEKTTSPRAEKVNPRQRQKQLDKQRSSNLGVSGKATRTNKQSRAYHNQSQNRS